MCMCMCSNAGHVLFRRGPRRRRALWRRAPQWTKTWWAPLPWGQLPMWLAEMVMAPEALQQSGVVVVGVDGVVATGGSRAVVVRAGARAAWVGWVPAEGARRRRGGAGRTRSEAAGRHRQRERVWARGARGATISLRACVADCWSSRSFVFAGLGVCDRWSAKVQKHSEETRPPASVDGRRRES